MTQPYLILHKVRGAPAFDIAERYDDMGTEDDPGPWWIIPTSGHRAYPYRQWKIEDLYDGSDMDMPKPEMIYFNIDPPEGWPDHYACNDKPIPKGGLSGLLAAIGLKRPSKIIRRKV